MRHVAMALKFLHDRGLIHCDLKPENVLWTGARRTSVKLIDFGCCCKADRKLFAYVQSRFYRAPEVILRIGYDRPIDIWSFGCVLAELVTGRPLFGGRDEAEQLALMVAVLGPPPEDMIAQSLRRDLLFDESRVLNRGAVGSTPLAEVLATDDQALVRFVKRCLEWAPADRITAEMILRHPWMCKRRG
jgi:dual specificity tyrosine-phosphorylation-regulated kinase 2/3/4